MVYTQFGLSVSFMMRFYLDTRAEESDMIVASYMITDCDSTISLLIVTHIHKLHWFSVQFLLLSLKTQQSGPSSHSYDSRHCIESVEHPVPVQQ